MHFLPQIFWHVWSPILDQTQGYLEIVLQVDSILEFCTHLLGFELQWLYLSGRFQGRVSGCSKALNSAIIWVLESHPLTFKRCNHSRWLKQNSIFFNLQIRSDWLSYPDADRTLAAFVDFLNEKAGTSRTTTGTLNDDVNSCI